MERALETKTTAGVQTVGSDHSSPRKGSGLPGGMAADVENECDQNQGGDQTTIRS